MKRFDTLQAWIREIKRTEGYRSTKPFAADLFEVNLTNGYKYNPSEIQDSGSFTFI